MGPHKYKRRSKCARKTTPMGRVSSSENGSLSSGVHIATEQRKGQRKKCRCNKDGGAAVVVTTATGPHKRVQKMPNRERMRQQSGTFQRSHINGRRNRARAEDIEAANGEGLGNDGGHIGNGPHKGSAKTKLMRRRSRHRDSKQRGLNRRLSHRRWGHTREVPKQS
jgi:hypothetical protein